MKRTVLACAAIAALLAGAVADETRTPAELVTQLGAERLADRDAASAALLNLGPQARDAVREALDSKDPEVQSRAKELWKTMRWLVIADANDDIAKLVGEADKGAIDASHWHDFVLKHGAESLLVVAEFRMGESHADNVAPGTGENVLTSNIINQPVFNIRKKGHDLYDPGLRAVLDDAPPLDVARLIAQADHPGERASLMALLDELQPEQIPETTAANWMKIQIALWNYEKAFNFGRDFSFRTASVDVVKQCAVAVDRGALFDNIQDAEKKDIASETNPAGLCTKLSFYTGLLSSLNKKPLIEPMFDLVQNVSLATADDTSLRRLVESLLNANMPARAVKVLHNVQSPLALYMRSAADLQIQDEPVAGTDWRDAVNTAEAVEDGKKKEVLYNLGELMSDWHDGRAELVWQRILSMQPATTVYDANACFQLGQFMEARRHYTEAADIYEKGLAIAGDLGGFLLATGPKGSATSGDKIIREKIKNLRSLAAGQKSLFDNSQPASPENK